MTKKETEELTELILELGRLSRRRDAVMMNIEKIVGKELGDE